MSSLAVHHSDSDSEDDPDYVPSVEQDSASSGDEEPALENTATKPHELNEEEKAAQKKARDDLWASFQASVAAGTSSTKPESPFIPMVKIEKSYRFAGEIVKEIVEVPRDSPEANKWPLWRSEVEEGGTKSPPEAAPSESSTSNTLPPEIDSGSSSSSAVTASQQTAATATAAATPKPRATEQRPGPRKPRTKLATLPSSSSSAQNKPKKLSTLDKSAMDWHAHVNSQAESGVKDELEANRRGGGYLEKVEFLHRVEERREDIFEASKSAKRRRT